MIYFIIGSSVVLLMLLLLFLYLENNWLDIDYYEYKTKVKKVIRICQISDLHSKKFGNNNQKLINEVEKINPNIIVYTGDMVHSKKDDFNISLNLMKSLSKYKSFYVTGNHEERMPKSIKEDYLKKIKECGVIILNNEDYRYEDILIRGISNASKPQDLDDYFKMEKSSEELSILLAHQPELFKYYNEDIVFSGHAHGGQFRFFGKGLYAPQQGLFPKYTSGAYFDDGKIMYVSRGLGGKDFPFRIFNRPHIIVLDILPK